MSECANPECTNICKTMYCCKPCNQRAWYLRNYESKRDIYIQRATEWKLKNPNAVKRSSAVYNKKHRNQPLEYRKKYYEKSKDKYALNNQLRRIRLASSNKIPFTVEQMQQKIAYYRGKCWICGIAEYEVMDHVKPLSKGGSQMLSNLRPACKDCNSRKHAKWPFRPDRLKTLVA